MAGRRIALEFSIIFITVQILQWNFVQHHIDHMSSDSSAICKWNFYFHSHNESWTIDQNITFLNECKCIRVI